jgi:RNA polymerase sigma factor (sigma-70 family)
MFIRRGNTAAFEMLVSRYQSRLLAFCRHLLGSREDAEDVLQEVFSAAFNAILADERPINVRPWLYRIARNRSLNHLRRIQAVGVDSMDIHFSDHGASTADQVHRREEFRMLLDDIQELPETQRTALILREMDALSYEQIAEAMETTVPSIKSLLVRARVSLAEAGEARQLTCDQVRIELGEAAEGLIRRPGPLVRRHVRACKRCSAFNQQLKHTNKALTALFPIGPLIILKKLALTHIGHSAGSSASGAGTAGQAAAVGSTAAAGSAVVGSGAGGFISAGVTAIAGKAAAGLAAAALVTAGAVEVAAPTRPARSKVGAQAYLAGVAGEPAVTPSEYVPVTHPRETDHHKAPTVKKVASTKATTVATATPKTATKSKATDKASGKSNGKRASNHRKGTDSGRTRTQTDPTVLASPPTTVATPPVTITTPASAPTVTTTTTTTPTTTAAPSTDTTPPAPTAASNPSSGGAPIAPPTTTTTSSTPTTP